MLRLSALSSRLAVVVLSFLLITLGETTSSASAAAEAAASTLAASLFVLLGDLLEAIIFFLISSCGTLSGDKWLALAMLTRLLRSPLFLTLSAFFSRGLGLVDDDLLSEFLLDLTDVLVSLSIVLILSVEEALKRTGEARSLLGGLSLLLLNFSWLLGLLLSK